MFVYETMTDPAPEEQAIRYGEYSVASNGAMTLPAEARRDIGIPDGGSVLIFGLPGRIVVTPSPLPDELLAFAAERAAARRSEDAGQRGNDSPI